MEPSFGETVPTGTSTEPPEEHNSTEVPRTRAEFGKALKKLRLDAARRTGGPIGLVKLAKEMHIGKSTLYDYFEGKSLPPIDNLHKVLDALKVTPDQKTSFLSARNNIELNEHDTLKATLGKSVIDQHQVIQELPPDVYGFIRRSKEIDQLSRLLEESGEHSVAGIAVISGTAGVGKTALAVHWGHQVCNDQFPDGDLYIDLRGYDPDRPMQPAEALGALLRSLGVEDESIPSEPDEMAKRYRGMLGKRRMLIVLDNANGAEQVRLLLPATPSCFVVITSRDSLVGVVARHGGRRVDLDLFSLDDAVALLSQLIGERVDSEPKAAEALARYCARLPLALRIAAELAVARPIASLEELANELAEEHRRLNLLNAGNDVRTAVRAVFSWSYRHLSEEQSRSFRLIGLSPTPDLDLHGLAALMDINVKSVSHSIDELKRAHLVSEKNRVRFGMHDLLRLYAREMAEGGESEAARYESLTKLFDYYLHTAAVAMDLLYPHESHRRPRIPQPRSCARALLEPSVARAWLDTELPSLTAIIIRTVDGWHYHTKQFGLILYRYLDAGSHYHEALTIHGCAHSVALLEEDAATEARALSNLGNTYERLGRFVDAVDHLQRAIAIQTNLGDRDGESRVLGNLGIVLSRSGRYTEAIALYEQALVIHREVGERAAEGLALSNIGIAHMRIGNYTEALQYYEQALVIHRERRNRFGEANVLNNLGMIYDRLNKYAAAVECYHQALCIDRELGSRDGEANTLNNLACAHRGLGEYADALSYHEKAHIIQKELRDIVGEAETLNDLGETIRAQGDVEGARRYYESALGLTRTTGDKYEEARSLNGLAHIMRETGCLADAGKHWQDALAIYQNLRVPEAQAVHQILDEITDQSSKSQRKTSPARPPDAGSKGIDG